MELEGAAEVLHVEATEHGLWQRWLATADAAARHSLLELHLPYARTVAATYYGRRRHDEIPFHEYLQYARVGMVEAFGRFDPSRGAGFRTFAAHRMHGAILDGLERCTEKQQQIAIRHRFRRASSSSTSLDFDAGKEESGALFHKFDDVGVGFALAHLLDGTGMIESVSDARHAETPFDVLAASQLHRTLVRHVQELPAQQRTVIRLHYLQDQSFEQIAEHMALTRGRISQIHRKGLTSLRHRMTANG